MFADRRNCYICNMSMQMKYDELAAYAEKMRKWAREKGITVLTASQPHRGGTGLSPEQIIELAKQPIVVDYVGLMLPSPSKALVPLKD
jgi:hypothetical protein